MPIKRAVLERLASARRDLDALTRGLRGGQHPYLVPRPKSFRAYKSPERRGPITKTLIVSAVTMETDRAVSLELETVDGSAFMYEAGQFLTIHTDVDGTPLRRAYSLSRAPHESPSRSKARITIKRIDGGRVSTQMTGSIQTGDRLQVLGPSGSFTLDYDPARSRRVVFIAAGSGITPIRALIASLLREEPDSRATLLYGNQRRSAVIFDNELCRLAHDSGRLEIVHVLEHPDEDATEGRLDEECLSAQLDGLRDAERYLVCGPAPVRAAAQAVLTRAGVGEDRILEEVYIRPELASDRKPANTPVRVRANLAGSNYDYTVGPGETLLEAGLAAGLPLDFSCAMGGCAACKLELVEGEVVMDEPNCLTGNEREANEILACVSRPVTACTVKRAS